jgi:multiple sugar transport system ATP-binding protein
MAEVILSGVTKRYGRVSAVRCLSLDCKDKEFVCLLGPSGAGKSSTLRMIGGLEEITEGEITIDGVRVNDLHPSQRDIAMVFETYALYPHMTVFQNIAYPLHVRGTGKAEQEQKVRTAAKILEIEGLLDRFPRQLSGGQKQRVAIGRAIVRNPRVFLMDEPIAHLDAKLRAHMRGELKHLQKELNETFIYATHDQLEAISMADRIAVINKGALQQFDVPQRIYERPANLFVAGFIGEFPMNLVPCVMEETAGAWVVRNDCFSLTLEPSLRQAIKEKGVLAALPREVVIGLRPEEIGMAPGGAAGADIRGVIDVTEPLGADMIVDVAVGTQIMKVMTDSGFGGRRGDAALLAIKPGALHLFDARSRLCLL